MRLETVVYMMFLYVPKKYTTSSYNQFCEISRIYFILTRKIEKNIRHPNTSVRNNVRNSYVTNFFLLIYGKM